MGLFDVFKRKEEPPPELPEEEVKIGSVLDWFKSSFRSELSDNKSEAERHQERLRKSFSDIRKSAKALEGVTFEKGDKTYAAANMIKDTVTKKIASASSGLTGIQSADWEALSGFCMKAQATVKEMLSLSPKQAILFSRYFGKDSERLISGIKETNEQLKELKEFLDNGGKVLWLEHQVLKHSREHRELTDRLQSLKREEKDTLGSRDRVRGELKERKQALEAFLKGREWLDYTEAGKEAEAAEKELARLKARISLELEPAKRPLKKLRHSGEKVSTGEMFDLVIQNREHQLASDLKKVLEMSDSGKLSLKDKDREKVRKVLKSLGGTVRGLKEDYRKQLALRKSLLERAGGELPEKKNKLEELLERAEKELNQLESELSRIGAEREETGKRQLELKKAIEATISDNSQRNVIINI